ncbi:hypothetical protein EPA93_30895 [Ktedonosporobacter rubrisoli]|uniref:Uncharacterized protein n=1 Tax=Ktedonosporobacter rubrisoli TaxID=2509675 RepID=A0A4P6JXP4_KTERU|nr:hypothetical protein [Ktedonosporobacter rubrisoli]QBD80150.1 hypothetical protein EPA93_30895 [Ktedonosporobacter rubrisoli]
MTPAEIEYANKRMKQKWYDLAMAEQQGVSTPTLERMYNAYMLAVDEYNRCCAVYQQEKLQEADSAPSHIAQQKHRRRRAS